MTANGQPCPQCRTPRQGQLRFCANCGFDYWKAAEAGVAGTSSQPAVPPSAGTPASVTNEAAAEKKNRRIGCIAIAVIAVLVIGFIGSLNSDEDPEAAGASQTAEPTPEPNPSEVPEPSAGNPTPPASTEPTPPPSPIASLEPEPAFADIELSGTGNAVPRFDIPEDSAAIAEIAHTGAANFVVWAVNASGEQTDLLVNTIGNYAGTVLFDESAGSHTDAFEVEADGTWTITIKPVTEAFTWDGAEQLAGTGDDVVILDPPPTGLKSTTVTHAGDGNFAIWAYGPETDLLVNEIGNFSGEVLLSEGTFLFEITANGPWTVDPPQ